MSLTHEFEMESTWKVECRDCGWAFNLEVVKPAFAKAKEHAEEKGHRASAIRTTVYGVTA